MSKKEKRNTVTEIWSGMTGLKSDLTYRQKLVGIAGRAAISPSRLEKFMHNEGGLTSDELGRILEDGDSFIWVTWYTKFVPGKRQPSFPML